MRLRLTFLLLSAALDAPKRAEPWTIKEYQDLEAAISAHGYDDLDKICEAVGPNRTK